MTRLFPFPGFLLEVAGVVFIAYGLITARSMLVTVGAMMLGLGLLLTVSGVLLRIRRNGSEEPEKSAESPDPPEEHESQTLYSDRLVTITPEAITFRHYSFPFGSSRRVEFSDIDHFTCEPSSVTNGKWRIWGAGSFAVWFPLDWHRPERDRIFFAALLGSGMRIGFTVEDPEKVMGILKKKGQFIMREDGRG